MEIITLIGGALIGLFGGVIVLKGKGAVDMDKTREKAEKLLADAAKQKKDIAVRAEEEIKKMQQRFDELQIQREELIAKMEESITHKESTNEKREQKTQELKLTLASQEEEIQALEEGIDKLAENILKKLTETSKYKLEKVKDELISTQKNQIDHDAGARIQLLDEYTRGIAHKKAESIVVNAIQRLSSATSVERRMINVKVTKDKAKGKIIGRGGANIQYLESQLGVDVVFNDQPDIISVSAFNLVNRKIAERALQILANEKNEIGTDTIDRAIAKSTKETDEELLQLGKKGAEKIGIKTEDKDLLRTIGRLQYRTSYGQNIMLHSLEVGWLAIMMGGEIGLTIETLKKGGFLHDLGKAIDQNPDVIGTHDYLTKEIMEKHDFSWEEIHAAWTHHDAEPPTTPEAMIVKAADAVSASRPGARQESLDKYVQRLKDLEGTAASFSGVKKAFAISAGREVRVIVDPEEVNDAGVQVLATDIAAEIQGNITYPGRVKVNVIRKLKYTELTKK